MAQTLIAEKALLVEGQDEVNFFKALLKHCAITGVDVQKFDGKYNFNTKLPTFLNSYGSQMRAYAIIQDADTNAEDTFQSIVNLLKKHGEPFPAQIGKYGENDKRRVGVFIMPGNREEGMLEDLCLQTVAEHPVMRCLDEYFSCLKEQLPSRTLDQLKNPDCYYFPKNPSKARSQAFLAGMYETFASVGVASLNGCWNFNHDILLDLKKFLSAL